MGSISGCANRHLRSISGCANRHLRPISGCATRHLRSISGCADFGAEHLLTGAGCTECADYLLSGCTDEGISSRWDTYTSLIYLFLALLQFINFHIFNNIIICVTAEIIMNMNALVYIFDRL